MLLRHSGLALAAALLIPGAAGCNGDVRTNPVEAAQLAVTVDAAGDEQQSRAMDIADRYAPGGVFTLEQEAASVASTTGASSSWSSAVVVFTVEGDVDVVVERLRGERHVLEVTRR